MLELRQVHISIFYFLKSLLDTNGYGSDGYSNGDLVTLMQAYPNDDELSRIVSRDQSSGLSEIEIVLPVIAIEYIDQIAIPFQLGSNDVTQRTFMISVIGNDSSEMEMLSQQVYEWLRDNNIDLNNYNAGFPPSVVPTKVGNLDMINLRMSPVRVIGSPDLADKYRTEIMFDVIVYSDQPSTTLFP